MSGLSPSLGLSGVLALRAEILERSQALSAARIGGPAEAAKLGGFGAAMQQALQAVNGLQSTSSADGAAWERGDTHDIASVMLSRQKASIAFEATLQARNRLLTAYRDIMNMPV
ncbi:flagellar hook-basal body complex protein FliE [Sandaracinobacter sp. RS1-74]|uniref:flagellar hook-basal body complex protein FliE n=1 Tax=Sandaracinobacteroides sayramensis TaxID=2913411 RepID=UPI001EDA200B|nr:flagellar hook-basal body complex protein FliE [Sandaracinobacteroides sayramensis]MCG2841966.1 flagellar hook-basal body complex protein FliE [Sandaracinobacteroides sayramensis]